MLKIASWRVSRLFCALPTTPSLQEISIVQPKDIPGLYNVQLNRERQRNTFTLAFWKELEKAFNYLEDEPDCRAIVLSANGPSFCAGIDLQQGVKELLSIMGEDRLDTARKARTLRKLIRTVQSSFNSLERCSKPVIAAIHSHCIGAGISLVSCADIRYASADSTFSIREVDIGLAADVIGAEGGVNWEKMRKVLEEKTNVDEKTMENWIKVYTADAGTSNPPNQQGNPGPLYSNEADRIQSLIDYEGVKRIKKSWGH
uniref:Delta(3,5)-Delta(2,4)-dienoyl-CoA isomerase, mitochondrial n=1 Tax=Globodera pallida TaxID=36090 RepID=A0A183BZ47_GLOPA